MLFPLMAAMAAMVAMVAAEAVADVPAAAAAPSLVPGKGVVAPAVNQMLRATVEMAVLAAVSRSSLTPAI